MSKFYAICGIYAINGFAGASALVEFVRGLFTKVANIGLDPDRSFWHSP